MIKPALITALACLISFAAHAKQLPYWLLPEKSAAETKAERSMKKRLLRQYKTPLLVSHQLMAAGWVLIVRGAPNTAIKRFNEAALFAPKDPAIPHGILIASGIRGDSKAELEVAYSRARALTPKDEHSSLDRDYGQVLLSQGHNDSALVAFRKSIKGHAEPGVLLSIARLFYAKGQKATARMYFDWSERVAQ